MPGKKKQVKCKNPDCQNLVYLKRHPSYSGFCHKHRDYTERSKIVAALNRLLKSKPAHLKFRTDSIPSVESVCVVCGNPFLAKPDNVRRNGGKICSPRCHGIRAAILTAKSDTKIERLIESALIAREWEYEKQKPIGGIAIVDFYLSKFNAIIFCDGEYWHTLPRTIKRSEIQNAELTKLGYNVFRFWEQEILRNPQGCLDQIAIRLGVVQQVPLPFPI